MVYCPRLIRGTVDLRVIRIQVNGVDPKEWKKLGFKLQGDNLETQLQSIIRLALGLQFANKGELIRLKLEVGGIHGLLLDRWEVGF